MPEQRLSVTYQPIASLRPNPRNARTHSRRQIQQIAESIRQFNFRVPIVVDEAGMILAGHGRFEAAKLLGLRDVPTIAAVGLSVAQKRTFALADNKIAANAGWDRSLLSAELGDLAVLLPEIQLDLGLTGFDPGEVDQLFADHDEPGPDPADELPKLGQVAVSRPDDLWQLGRHRILCGDARSAADIDRLMAGKQARLTFTDPPYNVSIQRHARTRGRTRHQEFAFASGEMSAGQFRGFLEQCLANIERASSDGAIAFVCIDWRHMDALQAAGSAVFAELKNLVVWNKTSPGQGTFYRSQHELIFVFKVRQGDHRNAFGLGTHGRTRSNVWTYPGLNSFRARRQAELALHPTVKPVALVADALRDCSMKGEIVLDTFLGSGTTLLAAEKVGRIAYALEYEPAYVDLSIRRWQGFTKLEAILEGDGRSYAEVSEARLIASGGHAEPQQNAEDHLSPPRKGADRRRQNPIDRRDSEVEPVSVSVARPVR